MSINKNIKALRNLFAAIILSKYFILGILCKQLLIIVFLINKIGTVYCYAQVPSIGRIRMLTSLMGMLAVSQ